MFKLSQVHVSEQPATVTNRGNVRVPHPLPTRVDSLDGLRALAIILVFFYHVREIARIPTTESAGPLYDMLGLGWIGVDLFYVLSGMFISLAIMRPRRWEPVVFAKRRC